MVALPPDQHPTEHETPADNAPRPFAELRDSGLLWLINATVFHPRGYALALTVHDGEAVGWNLLGDGSEPWRYEADMDAKFEAAEVTLREARDSR
jgi:hypothetical protein